MPRVGHVIFGEDSFGREQAKIYARLSGKQVTQSPKIDILIKGEGTEQKLYSTSEVIEWYGGW